MKQAIFFLYRISFFFIPIPIFLDFGNLSIIYHKVDEFNFLFDRPKIPFPLGGIFLLFSIIIGYVYSLVDPYRMQTIFAPKKLIAFYLYFVAPLTIYCLFVSELSLPRTIQMLFPIFILSTISFPKFTIDRLSILKSTVYGAGLFFLLHFLSIMIYAEDILLINDFKDFSSFYGILIYQSLVSYPGVLSLYFFLSLGVIYISKKQKICFYLHQKILSLALPFVLFYLLAASGRRSFLVEFFSSTAIILLFSFAFMIRKLEIKIRPVTYFFIFFTFSATLFFIYINSPLSDRVIYSIKDNTFDSGRSDILNRAYMYFLNNVNVLFFGAGGSESPGFHNYFLDQIYRIGLFGFFPLYLSISFLFLRFKKLNDLGTPYKGSRTVFIFIIISCGFWQSVINASISQPYYFINFLVTAILSFFTLFSPNSNDRVNRQPSRI